MATKDQEEEKVGKGPVSLGKAKMAVMVHTETTQFGNRDSTVHVAGPLSHALCESEDPDGDIVVSVVDDTLVFTMTLGTNIVGKITLHGE